MPQVKILTTGSIQELEQMINTAMGDGYQLYGNITIIVHRYTITSTTSRFEYQDGVYKDIPTTTINESEYPTYHQMMIKDTESNTTEIPSRPLSL